MAHSPHANSTNEELNINFNSILCHFVFDSSFICIRLHFLIFRFIVFYFALFRECYFIELSAGAYAYLFAVDLNEQIKCR